MFVFGLQIANGQDDNEVILDDLPTKLTGLTEVTTDCVSEVVDFHYMNTTSNWKSHENNTAATTTTTTFICNSEAKKEQGL